MQFQMDGIWLKIILSSQNMNCETLNPLEWQTIIDSINIAHLLLPFDLTLAKKNTPPPLPKQTLLSTLSGWLFFKVFGL